jgi:signal transduction histidine kinase
MSASNRTTAFIFILCGIASLGAELWSHRSAIDAAVSAVEHEIALAIVQDEVASLEANAKTLLLVSHGHILMSSGTGLRFAYPTESSDTCVFPYPRNLTLYGQSVGQLFICNSVNELLTEVIFFPRLLFLALLSGLSLATLALLPSRLHRRTLANLLAKVEEHLASRGGVPAPGSTQQGRDGADGRQLTIEAISSKLSDLFESSERERRQLEVEHARNSAVAMTTQALAHDVRKPFFMFQSIIQVVEVVDDPDEVREILRATLPEVNQAIASVDGLISDVMQIGAETRLITEEASPEMLIKSALGELVRVHPGTTLEFCYSLAHKSCVQVDTLKVARVFANILGNAVQAMGGRGSIWFHTLESGDLVQFTIGNVGPAIPEQDLPKLFDAFFTSGKKGGTGLGLAIAKKIIEAHGGGISCRSEHSGEDSKGVVEFIFTLPLARSACRATSEALPRTSRAIEASFASVRHGAAQVNGSKGPKL